MYGLFNENRKMSRTIFTSCCFTYVYKQNKYLCNYIIIFIASQDLYLEPRCEHKGSKWQQRSITLFILQQGNKAINKYLSNWSQRKTAINNNSASLGCALLYSFIEFYINVSFSINLICFLFDSINIFAGFVQKRIS